MRIAVTADTHWGIHAAGDAATRLLVTDLLANPPDLLILAGDQGAGDQFEPCLELFDALDCAKALVPGNHDIWVTDGDPRGDSLRVYLHHLPKLSARHGFHYLDAGPLIFDDAGLAIAGSMNWYDYSWVNLAELAAAFPDWEERLHTKRFTRGRHNDARLVRWQYDDRSFTAEAVRVFADQLKSIQMKDVLVVAHHPPLRGLNFPRFGPPTPDGLLWDAFSGNQAMEDLLSQNVDRIRWAFCGHTHRARSSEAAGIRGQNVGSDYSFKRLLRLEWPNGPIQERTFDVR